MEQKRIIKHLAGISENIRHDKIRLNNIVNVLNTGRDTSDINDKLIDSLANMEFKDPITATANEYISILFANMQTQKLSYNKEVTEEFIKILNHNLDLLDTIEGCIEVLSASSPKDMTIVERRLSDVATDYTRRSSDGKVSKPNNGIISNIIKTILPSNKVSNIMFWAFMLIIALTTAFVVDSNFYKHTEAVGNVVNHVIHEQKPTHKKQG